MMSDPMLPQGFILSDAALYSFQDQDVFPDLISFCSAIPMHLRPLFLIPISIQTATSKFEKIATRIASDPIPSGNTEEADLFGTKTFVYDDNQPTVPSSDPGSIFDIDGADNMTHHQDLEINQDKNIQAPSDTSFMSDVDLTESGFSYPYRTEESPVRHSSVIIAKFTHKALNAENLEARVPEKIKDNASSCSVRLISYDTRGKVYTFSVNCGNGSKTVRASLTDIDHLAMNCNCEFWRWNGPEFNAEANSFMLGQPRGTASPPDVRDPDRNYWLCKHAYAVLARMDEFVTKTIDNITEEGTEPDDEEVMDSVEENWDELEEVAEIPVDELEEENEIDLDWETSEEEVPEEEVEEIEEVLEPEAAPIDIDSVEEAEFEEIPVEEEPEEEPEPEPEEESEPKEEPEEDPESEEDTEFEEIDTEDEDK